MTDLLLIVLIFVTIASHDRPSFFEIEQELKKITYELQEIKRCLKEGKKDGRSKIR